MDNKFPRGIEVVGSAIIEDANGKILMTQSPKWANKWTFPGGHAEVGESIVEAQTREVEEEVGLKVDFVDIITWGELIDSKDFKRSAHFIYCDIYFRKTGGELKLDVTELTDYKWVTPIEALRLDLAESFEDTIRKFINYKANK